MARRRRRPMPGSAWLYLNGESLLTVARIPGVRIRPVGVYEQCPVHVAPEQRGGCDARHGPGPHRAGPGRHLPCPCRRAAHAPRTAWPGRMTGVSGRPMEEVSRGHRPNSTRPFVSKRPLFKKWWLETALFTAMAVNPPLPVAEGVAGKPSCKPLAESHTSGIPARGVGR